MQFDCCSNSETVVSRRDMLTQVGCGFGAMAGWFTTKSSTKLLCVQLIMKSLQKFRELLVDAFSVFGRALFQGHAIL